jgi:rhodanese-related sulfurtransferase
MRLSHLLNLNLLLLLSSCSSDENLCKSDPLKCPSDARLSDTRADRSVFDQRGQKNETGLPPADSFSQGADHGLSLVDSAPYAHEDVSIDVVHQWMTDGKVMTLVDVREPSEFQTGHLEGAQNLPWGSGVLGQSLGQLPTDRPVVVYCQSGNRSHAAATFLAGNEFMPVYDMLGGIGAWKSAGYPTVQ